MQCALGLCFVAVVVDAVKFGLPWWRIHKLEYRQGGEYSGQ
ncbi:hypothetical protein [Paenibacillus mellifer]|nr:hypothetical protein [Paenibacillus mellifer]